MKFQAQIKQRRLALGLQQSDMKLRIGMNQQQYQRIEAGGNPRLDTLELIAEGLDADLLLIPHDKLAAVYAALAGEQTSSNYMVLKEPTPVDVDPWAGILDKL